MNVRQVLACPGAPPSNELRSLPDQRERERETTGNGNDNNDAEARAAQRSTSPPTYLGTYLPPDLVYKFPD